MIESTLTTDAIWDLLQRGGAVRFGHFGLGPGRHTDRWLARFAALEDPRATAALARALLAKLVASAGAARFDLVLVVDEIEDYVLGFECARELGVPVVGVSSRDGILVPSRRVTAGARVLFVGDTFPDPLPYQAALGFLRGNGCELGAVAVLADAGRDGVPPVALVSVADHVWSTAECPLCAQHVPLQRVS
ncbi:MAG: hypothetical protein HY329_02115 [Chloroflexi bacterium]|nr:hypothetical protein [Chloroflexota bacterium]